MLGRMAASPNSRPSRKLAQPRSTSPSTRMKKRNSTSATSIKQCSSNLRVAEATSLNCNSVNMHGYRPSFSCVVDSDQGSPFTNPTGQLPAADAQKIKILDHGLNVLFSVPFTSQTWHNFAVVVDWDAFTLTVFYSQDSQALKNVSPTTANPGMKPAPDGQGEFHFGLLKVRYLRFHEIVSTDETLEIVAHT